MSDAPERIWAWYFIPSKRNEVMQGGWDTTEDRKTVKYIRADLVDAKDALIADLSEEIEDMEEEVNAPCPAPRMANEINLLKSCIAELEVKLAKARDDALEEAARVAEEFNEDCWEYSTGNRARVVGVRDDVATAILAIKGEQNNED